MGSRKHRPAGRALRPPMRSPGRPPGWRREHLERTMGFLKYERPLDPHSSRQYRFVWDPLFLEFCRATGGGRLFFDLDVYRGLDFASRRLFLLLQKLFGGKQHRTSPAFDIRHLAVHSLGFAEHLPVKILKQKLLRVIERMIDIGAIAFPAHTQRIDDLSARNRKLGPEKRGQVPKVRSTRRAVPAFGT